MADMKMRLWAYAPNGASLGLLGNAIEWTMSDNFNDVSSLVFKHSAGSPGFHLLQNPIEIAVEYLPEATPGLAWQEAYNGRFLLIQDDYDAVDPTGTHEFTCPGYAFNIDQAIMHMSPADRTRYGKRGLKNHTFGLAWATLAAEAKARGEIPGLSWSFSSTHDSAGKPWALDSIDIEFDAGTSLLGILKTLAEQRIIDWRMKGRQLQVFNAQGDMTAPRASRALLTQSSAIDLPSHVAAHVAQITAGRERGNNPPDAFLVSGANTFSALTGGGVINAAKGDSIFRATDTWSGRVVDILMENALPPSTNPWKGGRWGQKEFGHGVCYADGSYPIHTLILIPRLGSGIEKVAMEVFRRHSGVAVMMTNQDVVDATDKLQSGFPWVASSVISKSAINVLELYDASSSSLGEWPSNTTLQTQAGVTRNLWGSNTFSGLMAAWLSNQGLRTVYKPSNQWASPLDVSALSSQANRSGAHFAKVAILDTYLTTGDAYIQATAQAISLAILNAPKPRFLQKTMPKPLPSYTEPTQPAPGRMGPVDLRQGRELTEAPTSVSIAGLAGTVFAYGDTHVHTIVSNRDTTDLADRPWGVWAKAISAGGVSDVNTLEQQALAVLDAGVSRKYQFTRGISFADARWVPWRDYDTGDYVMAPREPGFYTEMRVQQMVIKKNSDGITGSLVMHDKLMDQQTRLSRAVAAANGGMVGGYTTSGNGARAVAAVLETRRLKAPGA